VAERRRKRRYAKKHRDFLDLHRHKYDDILKSQKGTCALCHRTPSPNRKLALDHRHTEPMKIRGLLCYRCNTALKEWMTSEWLLKAAKYVENDL
jgi:hypothetical protein